MAIKYSFQSSKIASQKLIKLLQAVTTFISSQWFIFLQMVDIIYIAIKDTFNFWKITSRDLLSLIIIYLKLLVKKKKALIGEYLSYLLVILYVLYFINKDLKIEGNPYFYTLSAISQTLAALIAFTGMFLVYRLQIIENERVSLSNEFEKIAKKAKEERHLRYTENPPNYNILYNLYDLNDKERYEKLFEFFEGLYGINEQFIPHEVRILITDYKKILDKIIYNSKSHVNAKKMIRKPMVYSLSGISLSIVFLAFGQINPLIVNNLIFGFIVLISLCSIFRILEVFVDLLWLKN